MDLQIILRALSRLDPDVNEHWTNDGLPRLGAISKFLDGDGVKRADVTNAAPSFNRDRAREIAEVHANEGAASTAEEESPDVADEPLSAPSEEGDADVAEDENDAEESPSAADDAPSTDAQEPDPEPVAELDFDSIDFAETPAMGMPRRLVMNSRPLLEQVAKEINEKTQALFQQKKAIEAEISQLATKGTVVDRRIQRFTQADPNRSMRDIQAYLKRCRETTAEKSQRAIKFIESGTNAKDVLNQLRVKSPLDAAMSSRKKGLGQGRPSPRAVSR